MAGGRSDGVGMGWSSRTSDSFLRQRFALGAGLAARTLERVADRHAAGETILVQRVEAMLGIAASTRNGRLTLAQEDYVIAVLTWKIHAPKIRPIVDELEREAAPVAAAAP